MGASPLTSDLRASTTRSLDWGPSLSTSGPRLSKAHTETRFPVTLCDADCTLHNPTLNGGAGGVTGSTDPAPEPLGMGGEGACPGMYIT